MRKLKPAELVALTALMSIGSYADAQEMEELPITNLPAMTVNTYYTPPAVPHYTNVGMPNSGYPSNATVQGGGPTAATRAAMLLCATQYGRSLPAGYMIQYDTRFMWKSQLSGQFYLTPSNSPPPVAAGPWDSVAGMTSPTNKRIILFAAGYPSGYEHFMTLTHEISHANGIGLQIDNQAEMEAVNAYYAYAADNGAKCGAPF